MKTKIFKQSLLTQLARPVLSTVAVDHSVSFDKVDHWLGITKTSVRKSLILLMIVCIGL
jgi:hypothetical protein